MKNDKQPSVRINGVPLSESREARFPQAPITPSNDLIGETGETPQGYSVRAETVRFDQGGLRVRLILKKDDQFIRHMDLTAMLCRDLVPIIEKAAGLAGSLLESRPDSTNKPWWDRVSVSDFRTRIADQSRSELQPMVSELKTAVMFAQSTYEASKTMRAKDDLRRLVAKRRELRQRLTVLDRESVAAKSSESKMALLPSVHEHKRPDKLAKKPYTEQLLYYFGRLVEQRLGRTESEAMFTEARSHIQIASDSHADEEPS